jgi:hypothetical protein
VLPTVCRRSCATTCVGMSVGGRRSDQSVDGPHSLVPQRFLPSGRARRDRRPTRKEPNHFGRLIRVRRDGRYGLGGQSSSRSTLCCDAVTTTTTTRQLQGLLEREFPDHTKGEAAAFSLIRASYGLAMVDTRCQLSRWRRRMPTGPSEDARHWRSAFGVQLDGMWRASEEFPARNLQIDTQYPMTYGT